MNKSILSFFVTSMFIFSGFAGSLAASAGRESAVRHLVLTSRQIMRELLLPEPLSVLNKSGGLAGLDNLELFNSRRMKFCAALTFSTREGKSPKMSELFKLRSYLTYLCYQAISLEIKKDESESGQDLYLSLYTARAYLDCALLLCTDQ